MSTDSTEKKVENCLKSAPYTTFWSPTISLFIIKYDEHLSDFLTTGVFQHWYSLFRKNWPGLRQNRRRVIYVSILKCEVLIRSGFFNPVRRTANYVNK